MDDTKKSTETTSAKEPSAASQSSSAQQQPSERNPAKQQTIKRLLSYAGKSRGLLPLSLVLSGLSALISFVPYVMVFFVIRDVISAIAAKEAVNAAAAFACDSLYHSTEPFDLVDGITCRTAHRLAYHPCKRQGTQDL